MTELLRAIVLFLYQTSQTPRCKDVTLDFENYILMHGFGYNEW